MKSLTKAIAVASLASVSVAASAVEGLTTTVGAVSEYVFRGTQLGDAGAYASLDYEMEGFYAGVWAIDDGSAGGNDGLETDFYVGYGWEQDDLSLGIAYNRYEYTYDTGAQVDPLGTGDDVNTSGQFEHEIALSAGFAGFGFEYAMGRAEADHKVTSAGALTVGAEIDTEIDYDVITLSYSADNWAFLVAQVSFDDVDVSGGVGTLANTDSEYNYAEFSAGQEISGLDFGVVIGKRFGKESGNVDSSSKGDDYIVLDISKSFDL